MKLIINSNMKTLKNTFIILILLISTHLFSQEKIVITEQQVDMIKGNQPAFGVIIPKATAKLIQESWTKKIRQNTKAKIQQEGAVFSIAGTRVIEIYNDPINIYSSVIQLDASVKLISLFEVDNEFLGAGSKDSDEYFKKAYENIRKFIYYFAVKEYKSSVSKELDIENKKLQNLAKQLFDLEKQKTTLHKNIGTNEQYIKKSETIISKSERTMENVLSEIDKYKASLSSASEEDKKDLNKLLTKKEKEKTTTKSKLEKEHKKVFDYQAKINELTKSLENNVKSQKETKERIDRQIVTIHNVTDKLNNIR